jgi:hypothetical protein
VDDDEGLDVVHQFVVDEVEDEHQPLALPITLLLIFIDEAEYLDSEILDDVLLQDILIKTVDEVDDDERDELEVMPHTILLLIENDELEVYDFVQTYLELINVSLEEDDDEFHDVDVIDDEMGQLGHDDEEVQQLVEVEDDELYVVAEINDEAERDDYLLLDTHVLADILYHEVTANIYVVDTVFTVS